MKIARPWCFQTRDVAPVDASTQICACAGKDQWCKSIQRSLWSFLELKEITQSDGLFETEDLTCFSCRDLYRNERNVSELLPPCHTKTGGLTNNTKILNCLHRKSWINATESCNTIFIYNLFWHLRGRHGLRARCLHVDAPIITRVVLSLVDIFIFTGCSTVMWALIHPTSVWVHFVWARA